eukprot:7102644-Pyramimonas_sp.AAC.1
MIARHRLYHVDISGMRQISRASARFLVWEFLGISVTKNLFQEPGAQYLRSAIAWNSRCTSLTAAQ